MNVKKLGPTLRHSATVLNSSPSQATATLLDIARGLADYMDHTVELEHAQYSERQVIQGSLQAMILARRAETQGVR